jgi:predicted transcriptional regulator
MKVFDIISRLQLMHKLISEKKTGSPDEFAKRLGIKRRTLYEIIDEMKSRDLPITYSRNAKTFFYEQPVNVEVLFKVKPLSRDELEEKNAGSSLFFFRAVFPHGVQLS